MRGVEREVGLVEHFAAEAELEVVEDSLEVQQPVDEGLFYHRQQDSGFVEEEPGELLPDVVDAVERRDVVQMLSHFGRLLDSLNHKGVDSSSVAVAVAEGVHEEDSVLDTLELDYLDVTCSGYMDCNRCSIADSGALHASLQLVGVGGAEEDQEGIAEADLELEDRSMDHSSCEVEEVHRA
jgi:hypothetical protein